MNQPNEQLQSPATPPVAATKAAERAAAAHAAARKAAAAHRAAIKANGATTPAGSPPKPQTNGGPQPAPPATADKPAQPTSAPQPAAKPAPPKAKADPRLAEARNALPALMKQLKSIAQSEKRSDLLETLDTTKRRSADSCVRVAFVGLRRKGKSHLINALLNANLCAVGDRRSTSVITTVRAAEAPSAKLLVAQPDDPEPHPMPLPIEEIQSDLAKSQYADGRDVVRAEIGINSSALAGNLALTDTPGVGGRGQPHVVRVLNEVAISDAVILVTDASQEFTQPELHFLGQVLALCPTGVVALTKTDIYPDWRRILEADQRHLDSAGFECPIMPLSAVLRQHALKLSDKQLNAESGYPALLEFIRNGVIADAATTRIARIARDFDTVAQHLTLPLEAQLKSLRDPEFRERMTAELKEQKQLSDAARQGRLDLAASVGRWHCRPHHGGRSRSERPDASTRQIG